MMQADGIHPTAEAQSQLLETVWPGTRALLRRGRATVAPSIGASDVALSGTLYAYRLVPDEQYDMFACREIDCTWRCGNWN